MFQVSLLATLYNKQCNMWEIIKLYKEKEQLEGPSSESECRLISQLDYTSPLTPEFDPSDRPISDIFGKHLLLLGLCVQKWHSDSRRQAAAHSSWVSAPSGPRSTWSPRLRYTFICCIVNMISSNYSLGQIEWMIV